MISATEQTIGARLKAARLRASLSQAELATASGVSQQTIAKIESGQIHLSRHLPRLAQVLGVPLEEIDTSLGTSVGVEDLAARPRNVSRGTFRKKRGRPPDDWFPTLRLDWLPAFQFWPNSVERGTIGSLHSIAQSADVLEIFVPHDDMSPVVEPGDVVAIDPGLRVIPGSDCAFFSEDESGKAKAVVIRRLVRSDDLNWHVQQFNPPAAASLSKAEFQNAFRVAAIIRRP